MEIEEFDEVTGGCNYRCGGDSIDGHKDGCLWFQFHKLKSDILRATTLLQEAELKLSHLESAWVSAKESEMLRKKIRKFIADIRKVNK